jgi:hypothetical protein
VCQSNDDGEIPTPRDDAVLADVLRVESNNVAACNPIHERRRVQEAVLPTRQRLYLERLADRELPVGIKRGEGDVDHCVPIIARTPRR